MTCKDTWANKIGAFYIYKVNLQFVIYLFFLVFFVLLTETVINCLLLFLILFIIIIIINQTRSHLMDFVQNVKLQILHFWIYSYRFLKKCGKKFMENFFTTIYLLPWNLKFFSHNISILNFEELLLS